MYFKLQRTEMFRNQLKDLLWKIPRSTRSVYSLHVHPHPQCIFPSLSHIFPGPSSVKVLSEEFPESSLSASLLTLSSCLPGFSTFFLRDLCLPLSSLALLGLWWMAEIVYFQNYCFVIVIYREWLKKNYFGGNFPPTIEENN